MLLVCPVYFYGIPPLVADFLARVQLPRVRYFSAVFTAEFPNGRAITELQAICLKKGLELNSAFYLKMPTNYVIKSRMPGKQEIEHLLDRAEQKMARVRSIVAARRNFQKKDSLLYAMAVGAGRSIREWEKVYPQWDSPFRSQENCTASASKNSLIGAADAAPVCVASTSARRRPSSTAPPPRTNPGTRTLGHCRTR